MTDSAQKDTSELERQLFDTAHKAAAQYAKYSREQVEKILKAVSAAAAEKAEFYADWAVRETGFGDVPSKTLKNRNSLAHAAKDIGEFIDPVIDHDKKIIHFPKPAGVVVALIPSTNPVATVYYKVICTLITRNAVVLCPHPGAKECSIHAADLIAEAATKAGAPPGLIQSVRKPSVPLVNKLMQSDRTSLILATGGPAMVRAAYSSSNPAIGVGPGNVACYVNHSADVEKAAEHIAGSVSFDNSLPCTTESVIIADNEICAQLTDALTRYGTHLVRAQEDIKKVRDFLFPENHMNPKAIGKSAQWIADHAGIQVSPGTRLLCLEIFTIGKSEPISKEKMFPLVGLIKNEGCVNSAIRNAQGMLEMQGKGHSAVIHSKDPDAIARYGDALPVCRIAVNTAGATGSTGITTNLITGAVIGTGFFGRSSVSENIGPKHLIQWTNVAYNNDPSEVMGDIDKALMTLAAEKIRLSLTVATLPAVKSDDLRSLIREILADELRQILSDRQ